MRLFPAVPLFLVCAWPLFAGDTSSFPQNDLFKRGGFEEPAVHGRTPVDKGADPTNGGNPPWITFKIAPDTTGSNADGQIAAGLTDEIAHSGKQAMYINFQHVKTPYQSLTLTSNFVPVVSGSLYQVNIWGRADAKAIITRNDRPAYLKVEIDFFGADGNQSVGDPSYTVLPIGGGGDKDHPPFFKPDDWTEFFTKVTAPQGAVFAQMIWTWESAGSDPGEINGTIFFDDVTVQGAPNANPDLTPAPIQEATPAPDQTGTDAATPEPSTTPAAQ
jgi:hypothetical protein